MRQFVALLLTSVASASAAHGAVIAQNQPLPPFTKGGVSFQDGIFSDGLASGGNQFYSQAFGQSFSIGSGDSATISNITFWGASEYIGSQDPSGQQALSSNIASIQISILRISGSTSTNYPVVANWSIPAAQLTQVRNGNYVPNILSPVFQISTALAGNVSLGAGDYILSIGAILNNPGKDSFAWIDGEADGSLPGTRAYATTGDVSTEWGFWSPVTDGSSGAFVLEGSVVPAPGALAALAALGARRTRRRTN
jgi:hypothetical protein